MLCAARRSKPPLFCSTISTRASSRVHAAMFESLCITHTALLVLNYQAKMQISVPMSFSHCQSEDDVRCYSYNVVPMLNV